VHSSPVAVLRAFKKGPVIDE